ncbi:unnamed protein product [Sphagnum balticum]
MTIGTEMCIILIRLLFRSPHHQTSIDPAKGASTTTTTRTPRAAAATQQYICGNPRTPSRPRTLVSNPDAKTTCRLVQPDSRAK